jgi:hypothetical protein
VCDEAGTNPDVVTWISDDGGSHNWDTPGNWSPTGLPDPDAIACIETTDTVVVGAGFLQDIEAAQIHLAGAAELEVVEGAGLFVNGDAESVWAPGTSVTATMGQLGGSGTIRAQGQVTFTSGAFGTFLTSVPDGGGDPPPADTGELVVEGQATLSNLGLGLLTGYEVTVANTGTFSLVPNGFVAADYGTAMTVEQGGLLDFTGDGDYHQGFAVDGEPLSVLTNHGVVRKSGGGGTSVVDATYAGAGQVEVRSGTLALPDNQLLTGSVSPGTVLATGRCEEAVGQDCQATTDPAKDEMSLAFTVPGANSGAASVQLQELGPVSDAVDPNGLGNEVLAHADGLTGAARIDLRFSQADVMATPLHEVQVMHVTDAGPVNQVVDCVGGAVPAGHDSCVLRPVTRSADNTFVSVLTKTTSRWRLRRGQAVQATTPAAAGAPQGLTVKEAAPFDGSVLAVAWSPPATSGTAPVTSYRVALDGQVVATPAATSVTLKNPGPGAHKISVAAVSVVGQGPEAVAAVTVAALSKPRQVTDVRGAPGGKLTAGAHWKPPADAGGFSVTKYKIAVFTHNGRRVDTEVVGAGKRSYLFKLQPGRYVFKVRARNTDRWGPWSKATEIVRPR